MHLELNNKKNQPYVGMVFCVCVVDSPRRETGTVSNFFLKKEYEKLIK